MSREQDYFHDAHLRKIVKDEFLGYTRYIIHKQGMNYNSVGILWARLEDFIHVHPIEFVVTAVGKDIIIATINLTEEFYDKMILVEAVTFIASEIDLVATILAAIIRGTSCHPCSVGD